MNENYSFRLALPIRVFLWSRAEAASQHKTRNQAKAFEKLSIWSFENDFFFGVLWMKLYDVCEWRFLVSFSCSMYGRGVNIWFRFVSNYTVRKKKLWVNFWGILTRKRFFFFFFLKRDHISIRRQKKKQA